MRAGKTESTARSGSISSKRLNPKPYSPASQRNASSSEEHETLARLRISASCWESCLACTIRSSNDRDSALRASAMKVNLPLGEPRANLEFGPRAHEIRQVLECGDAAARSRRFRVVRARRVWIPGHISHSSATESGDYAALHHRTPGRCRVYSSKPSI